MKAVLVVDMPSNCDDCQLHLESSGGEYRRFCVAHNEISVGKKIPKWCPLKKMPEEKEVGYPNSDSDVGFGDGWDACIKEITK